MKFNIGDKVTVLNTSKAYTTHGVMFTELGFENKLENRPFTRGSHGVVFATKTPEDGTYNPQFVAVRNDLGQEMLIGCEGLELFETKYEKMFNMLNIGIGDRVLVTHAVPSHNLGWGYSWLDNMHEAIGYQYKVERITQNKSVILHGFGETRFPVHSLELVSKNSPMDIQLNRSYKGTVSSDGNTITVGCQTFSFEKIEELYKTMLSRK